MRGLNGIASYRERQALVSHSTRHPDPNQSISLSQFLPTCFASNAEYLVLGKTAGSKDVSGINLGMCLGLV